MASPREKPAKSAKKTATKTAAKAGAAKTAADGPAAVAAFLAALDAPSKAVIEAVREIVLGVSPAIGEGIKWNAPSFHTRDHFATFNLRGKEGVRLVLHTGAKTKETAKTGVDVPDPGGILEWMANDRAVVTFTDGADVERKRAGLSAIVRAWVRYL